MPSSFKKKIQRWFWPLMPGYPDEARRIVQGPHLRQLLCRAAGESGSMRRVFNAGAGEGGYSPLILNMPGVEESFESDFSYLTQKPNRIDPRQRFFGASLTSIPLADKTIDLVLCTEVLEHIQQHESALDELARVMAPGGWLLITVPTPPAPPDANHVREGYRPAELSAMLGERGFEVVETRFCMRYFFRFILAHWAQFPFWCPRIVIRTMGLLDRVVPLGPPMDLLILARFTEKRVMSFETAVKATAHAETERVRA